jgi:hypothetical protein
MTLTEISAENRHYIFFVKTSLYIFQYFVNFFWRVEDLRLKILPLVELFVLYKFWKFELNRTSPSTVINDTIFKNCHYTFFVKTSLYIFQYFVNFFWRVEDLRLKFLPLVELFVLYKFWKFELNRTSPLTVINETTFKTSLYKVSEISFFQKVRLFYSWNEPDKRELLFMSFLLKEFSFFSYSLHSTNSITVRVRIMFVSLYTKMYKCLSYYMKDERRNEWEIKLKSNIYSDRHLNAVQNSVSISFSSCLFTVEKFAFLSTCHEKMTFSRNTFLITQRLYELMSWNFVR